MKLRPWDAHGAREVARTRVYRVLEERWRSPRDGAVHSFSTLDCADWVNVIPIDRQGRMVLVRQFRFGTRRFTLEVPGGMVDAGESPRAAAERELLEETGYRAEGMVGLGSVEPNPALQNNRNHLFLAEGCEPSGALSLDPSEDIEVLQVPVDEVLQMVRSGAIYHALMVALLFRFELHRNGRLELPLER